MYTTSEAADLTHLQQKTILQYIKRYGVGTWSDRLSRWLLSDEDLGIIEARRRK